MLLATAERAQVGTFVFGVGAVAAIASHVPENAEGLVIGGNEATAGAFQPCWFSVEKFRRRWGVLVEKNCVTPLGADEAVGSGGGPPAA